MIARHWGAVVKRERASDYIAHLRAETFPKLRAFAGADAEAAVVPAHAQAMMVSYDARVRHYEVIE